MTTAICCLTLSGRAIAASFTSTPVVSGTYNAAYNYDITTTGMSMRVVTLSDGNLPDGLNFMNSINGSANISGTPTETGDFFIELTVTDIFDPDNFDVQAFTLTISKATATITLTSVSAQYDGNSQSAAATTDPAGLDVIFTYDGSTNEPEDAGTYALEAIIDDPNYAGTTTGTFEITKAPASITLETISAVYDGSPKSASATTNPSGLDLSFTYDGSATAPTNVGSYALVATVDDPNYEGSASGTFEITKAPATVTLQTTTVPYNGAPQSATATTDPVGLNVVFTYDGLGTAPTNVGSYALVATIDDPNYEGSASGTFEITKATATVTLGTTSVVYNGSQQSATATTDPAGLSVVFTYDGLTTAPTNVGNYALVATINDPNYEGTASGTFEITKAAATVTLGTTSVIYNGSPQSATATTSPAGLDLIFTYNGSTTAPTTAGTYALVAAVNDNNYEGSASGTFEITKATATVTLGTTSVVYNGSPQSATATTSPAGLGLIYTYDGSTTAPTNAGTYALVATINDVNYTGSASGIFEITKATASINFTSLSATYDGTPKSASYTTTPSGLTAALTYNGSVTPPTNAGSYTVEAKISNANYQGTATDIFIIAKGTATINFGNLNFIYDGAAKSATATTVPPGLTVSFTYDGSTTAPANAGTYNVVATLSTTNYEGTNSATMTISKASATVSISNTAQNFDGSPKSVTVTTLPSGLSTNVTYNGSGTAPTAAGSYAVVATVVDLNYTGSASSTLIINGPPITTGILDVNVNEDAANYVANLKQVFEDNEDSDNDLVFTVVSNTNPSLFESVTITATKSLVLDFAANQSGDADITIRATDTGGLFVEDQFHVNVAPVQDIPVFTTTPVTGILQGENYLYEPVVTDADISDVLVYTNVFKPSWLSFTDNGDGTGTLSGVPAVADIGTHFVSLEASDDKGNSVTQNFNINVAASNEAPVFTSTAVTSVAEDATYTYNITTSDPDGNDVDITAITKPTWLTLTDNGNGTAQLTGVPTNAQVGTHSVKLKVADIFGIFSEQSFTITVSNTNDAPEFTSAAVVNAQQNVTYTYNIVAVDVDTGDNLSITASGTLPAWLSLTDNGNGKAVLTGTHPVDQNNNLSYPVTLRVEDALGAADLQSFTIKVVYQNQPPTLDAITDVGPLNEDNGEIIVPLSGITTGGESGQTITITAASDNTDLIADDFTVNYTSPNPTGSISFEPKANAFGEANITVTVKDNGAEVKNSVTRTFKVTINPINDVPVFTSTINDVSLLVGDEFLYQITTADVDGDALTITAEMSASWLTLVDNGDGTAELSGTVPANASGSFLITLKVVDPLGEFSTQSFTITINRAPTASSVSIIINEDEVHNITKNEFALGFTDPDGDEIKRIKIESLPTLDQEFERNGVPIKVGDEIVVTNGEITGLTYEAFVGGQTSFKWSAYDGASWSNSADFTITVLPVNDAPSIKIEVEATKSDTIYYSQGDGARSILEDAIIIINDEENAEMAGAKIWISKGYASDDDELLFENNTNTNISGAFNASTGELTLTGTDKRSAYEEAIANVQYRSNVLGVTDILLKEFSITVTDGESESNIEIRPLKISEVLPDVKIYSAFTPNGDGKNDTWYFDNLDAYTSINISVFNDAGQRVFQCTTASCSWDGTYEGKPVDSGPYFYTVDLNDGKRKFQGTVTVLK